MKAYAVINHALHHNSSYWRIIGIFLNETDAYVCIATDKEDVMHSIDRGDFVDDTFSTIAEDPDLFINTNLWDDYLVSGDGFYECWRVEEYELLSNRNTDNI